MSGLLVSPRLLGTVAADVITSKTALNLDFDISFQDLAFSEKDGLFQLTLDYEVGSDADGLNITLYETGCDTLYTGESDPIIDVVTTDDAVLEKVITVKKRLFSVNNTRLVTHDEAKGLSKGSLNFCAKAQTWVDGISAEFHKQNLKLTYDLSDNNFEILNNDITTKPLPVINKFTATRFFDVDCLCSSSPDPYVKPVACDFAGITGEDGNWGFMQAKFDEYAVNGNFDGDPVLHGDTFTYSIVFPEPTVSKFITLLQAPFVTENNVTNFAGLEVIVFHFVCENTGSPQFGVGNGRPFSSASLLDSSGLGTPVGLSDSSPVVSTGRPLFGTPIGPNGNPESSGDYEAVLGNVVVTSVENFSFNSTSQILDMDIYATATGEAGNAQAAVEHESGLNLHFTEDGVDLDLTGPGGDPSGPKVIVETTGTISLDIDTTGYKVGACQCTKDAYDCVTGVLGQSDLIHVCLLPDLASRDSVEISNFFMEFKQGDSVRYRPVGIGTEGPEASTLAMVQDVDSHYKVTSRLVTALFDEGTDEFVIVGNAYLEFKQSRRLNGRSLQGSYGGESYFSMEVQFDKEAAPAVAVAPTDRKSLRISLSVGLACLVLSVAFVFLKKK